MNKRKLLADLLRGDVSEHLLSDYLEQKRIDDLHSLSDEELRECIADIEADLERIDREEQELEQQAATDPEANAELMQYRQALKEMGYLELLKEIETLEKKLAVLDYKFRFTCI